jgi:hypothetical protein
VGLRGEIFAIIKNSVNSHPFPIQKRTRLYANRSCDRIVSGGGCRRFALKGLLVIPVGKRAALFQDLGVDPIADKDGVGPQINLVDYLCPQNRQSMVQHQRAAGTRILNCTWLSLSTSRLDRKPKGPRKVIGADSSSPDTPNKLFFEINSWIRFCLMMITATLAGSERTWKTVLTIRPVNRSPSSEVTI